MVLIVLSVCDLRTKIREEGHDAGHQERLHRWKVELGLGLEGWARRGEQRTSEIEIED